MASAKTMESVALANATIAASTAGSVAVASSSATAATTSVGVGAVEAYSDGGPILGSLH